MKRVIPPIKGHKGQAFRVPGHSINTDIITPARLLKCLSFDELGPHVFEDARTDAAQAGNVHPFDVPENQGSSVLIVDSDFGSGSSREHSPQALKYWGIKAIVGLSFANIFRNNCRTNGIICVDLNTDDHKDLLQYEFMSANTELDIDLETMRVTNTRSVDQRSWTCTMPSADRDMFMDGTWDSIVQLLETNGDVDALLASLPYVRLRVA